jgi:hypothetical protein
MFSARLLHASDALVRRAAPVQPLALSHVPPDLGVARERARPIAVFEGLFVFAVCRRDKTCQICSAASGSGMRLLGNSTVGGSWVWRIVTDGRQACRAERRARSIFLPRRVFASCREDRRQGEDRQPFAGLDLAEVRCLCANMAHLLSQETFVTVAGSDAIPTAAGRWQNELSGRFRELSKISGPKAANCGQLVLCNVRCRHSPRVTARNEISAVRQPLFNAQGAQFASFPQRIADKGVIAFPSSGCLAGACLKRPRRSARRFASSTWWNRQVAEAMARRSPRCQR